MEIKIRKWFIFTELGVSAIPYILDLSNEDVDDDEISYCIREQVYMTPFASKTKVEE